MRIESYNFGTMVIDGETYTSDLIIYPDGRILSSWWRQVGHSLVYDDIAELIDRAPEIIVAGTGAHGIMKPDKALISLLDNKGIQFEALPTAEAVNAYNRFSDAGHKVGGCFHLTC